MALSDDQRAMLRLLAQREQGYDDIAALMGLSVEQVRAKVKEALAEIEAGEASAPSSPPVDPGAGQPAPAPPAPEPTAAEPVPSERPAPAPVPSSERPAPGPVDPSPPAGPAESSSPEPAVAPKLSSPSPAQATAKPLTSAGSKLSLPSSRRRLIEWVGGAVVVILIVLFATGTIDLGGGDSDSTATTPTTTGSAESGEAANTAAGLAKATKAVLTPVSGGEGAGLAIFGKIKKTAILQVEAKGLAPSAKGQSYTVWLYRSPKLVLRIGAVAVPKSGTIAAQFPIPEEVLAYVANGAFDQIDISRTQNSDYEAEVAQAEKQKRLPAYTGEDVLRGKITGPAIKK